MRRAVSFVLLLAVILMATRPAKALDRVPVLWIPMVFNKSSDGVLRGQVVNAVDGTPIAGAFICINLNGISCYTSGSDGKYFFSGLTTQTYNMIVNKEGFQEYSRSGISVTAGQSITVDVMMSPQDLAQGAVRIIATWGRAGANSLVRDIPSDLDAHLWLNQVPAGHVYYSKPGDCLAACLQNDNQDFGPETLTIQPGQTGTHTYAVFMNLAQYDGITYYGVVLQIYDAGGLKQTLLVPAPDPSRSGSWWRALDFYWDSGQNKYIFSGLTTIQILSPFGF